MAVEELFRISECACLSQNVTYQCTVCGGLFTVWKFPNTGCSDITLRHANFSAKITIECGNIRATGEGLYEDNDCYTSELMVLVRPSITIECAVDDGTAERVINTSELIISSGMLRKVLLQNLLFEHKICFRAGSVMSLSTLTILLQLEEQEALK